MTEVRGQRSEIRKESRTDSTTKKVILLCLCSLLLAPCSSVVDAQQAKKIPQIGFLSSVAQARDSTRFEAIRLGLRELGYIEGQNLTIEYRYVVYDPAIPAARREIKEDVPVAARAVGLTVRTWELRTTDGLENALAAISQEPPDGLYVLGAGPLMAASNKRIAAFALKSRLPSIGGRPYVDADGLMSYGADAADSYRRVSTYVDKILKGAKPGDLPVQQPTKFEFVINQRTAKQIGLRIPANVLARADKVIK